MTVKTDILNSDFSKYRNEEMEILERYVDQVRQHADVPEFILYNWPCFVRSQEITRFLVYYEIFKMIQNVHGSIVQLGVLNGNTLFSYALFSEIFEHRNYTRQIFGFDTFGAYEALSDREDKDKFASKAATYSEDFVRSAAKLFNDAQMMDTDGQSTQHTSIGMLGSAPALSKRRRISSSSCSSTAMRSGV